MKKKKVLRKVLWNACWIIYWISLGMVVTTFILGERNILNKIALIMNLIYLLLIYVIPYILGRIQYKSVLNSYRDVFKCLKTAHGMRYRCYLNSNMKQAEEYSELVKMCVNALVHTGEKLVNSSKAMKKERAEIKDIMDKAKVLEKSIVPFFN